MNAETTWRTGRFDGKHGRKSVLFGRMYEDAEVELSELESGTRVFCIASAGCTAMRLCDRHEVVACDINPAQLAYAARRIAGEPTEVGTAERVMRFARAVAPIAGWSHRRLREFADLREIPAQLAFWRQHLDTWRFRAGFATMMSVPGLRAVYSPPLLAVLPRRFGAVLRRRMERCFGLHPNASNPYLRLLLLGETVDVAPPRAPERIELVLSDAASYLEACPAGSFGGFTLSNILDAASGAYRQRLLQAVRRAATKDARVVLRSFAEPTGTTTSNRAERDRAMLWGIVDVRRARRLGVAPTADPARITITQGA